MKKKVDAPLSEDPSESAWEGLGEMIAEGVSDAIMLIDSRNYKILAANKAFSEIYGVRWGPRKGRYCHEVTHRRQSPCGEYGEGCPVEEVVRTGKPCAVEHLHRTLDGAEWSCQVIAYPIPGSSGALEKILHIARDTALLKRREKGLVRTGRAAAIRQVAATLAHEINNPLTGILLATRKLSREEAVSVESLRQIVSIEEAAARIQRVLKKLERLRADRIKEYIPGIQMLDLDGEE